MATQKKSKIASERDEEIRGLWRWLASRFDARRLVFVDESGFDDGTVPKALLEWHLTHGKLALQEATFGTCTLRKDAALAVLRRFHGPHVGGL
jgi:hypothetical protein